VVYSPLELIVPGLQALPDGACTDQVTPLLKSPVPVTVAVNCTCAPMVTGPVGVTVTLVIAGPVGPVLMGVPALPPPPQPVAAKLSAVPINSAEAQARFLTQQIRRRLSIRQVPRAKPSVIFQAPFIAYILPRLARFVGVFLRRHLRQRRSSVTFSEWKSPSET
jgi:hypothetical protein